MDVLKRMPYKLEKSGEAPEEGQVERSGGKRLGSGTESTALVCLFESRWHSRPGGQPQFPARRSHRNAFGRGQSQEYIVLLAQTPVPRATYLS